MFGQTVDALLWLPRPTQSSVLPGRYMISVFCWDIWNKMWILLHKLQIVKNDFNIPSLNCFLKCSFWLCCDHIDHIDQYHIDHIDFSWCYSRMYNVYRSVKGLEIHIKHLHTACMDTSQWSDQLKAYLRRRIWWNQESIHFLSKNDHLLWPYLH